MSEEETSFLLHHPNWKVTPNTLVWNNHSGFSHAFVCFLCACAQKQVLYTAFRRWPKIITLLRKFPTISYQLPNLDPQGCPCPACSVKHKVAGLHPGQYFLSEQYTPQNNPSQERDRSVYFVVFLEKRFLQRSSWIILTWDLPEKIPLFTLMNHSICCFKICSNRL